MNKRSQRFTAIICALVMAGALAMTGCGGSGSSAAAAATTTITGQVVDGIIAGATCNAYQINSNGTKGTLAGGPATADANGNYTITMSHSGPVLVECAGGSYKDWATGNTVSLTASDVISAVIPNASGTVTANITPLTYMAAKLALQEMATNATAAATAVTNANSSIGQYFGITDIIGTPVIDPTVAGSATGATQATKDYSLVLAGISKYAATNSITTPFQLVVALANDAGDGTFDGKQGTTQLTVGITNLSSSTSTSGLSTAITAFQGSATNTSGATVTTTITTNLTTSTGTLLPQPLPAAPTITSFTPTSGPVGTTTVIITGTNFSTQQTSNTVSFNGVQAIVGEASATQLWVTVPATATTGKITVLVGGQTATSATNFTVTAAGTGSGNVCVLNVSGPAGTVNYCYTHLPVSFVCDPIAINGGVAPGYTYTPSAPATCPAGSIQQNMSPNSFPAIATTTAQNLTAGTPMASFTPLLANGGTAPYTYSHTGTLPAGLSFNTSTGAVTGTPTAAYATTDLEFSVQDANGGMGSTPSIVSFAVAGNVVQGGLTWTPVTFGDTWSAANAYCTGTTISGQTGWRLPTQTELSSLYTSGAMNGVGWTLNWTWSSTPGNAGYHYAVNLASGANAGAAFPFLDTLFPYVSCVR